MFGSGFGAGAMGNSFGALDPAMANQMLQNPIDCNMMQSPQFRQMLSNPDMIRQMATMSSMFGGQPAAGTENPFSGLGNNAMDPQLQQRMAAMMGGAAPASPADTRSPEERFQVQLQQLNEMGLWDAAKNIRALTATGGNVNAAIEMLFSGNV
ncbi:unnamed protein product [Rhizopus stolonifer]